MSLTTILDRRGHGPRRRAFALATGLALAANLTLVAVSPAMAVTACGDTLQGSVTLTVDLGPCSGDGLILDGLSGVTIDLNGHSIFGDDGVTDSGIRIVNGSKKIKILNGVIEGFGEYGVNIEGSSSVAIDDLLLRDLGESGVAVFSSSKVALNNVIALDTTGTAGYGFYFNDNLGSMTISNSSVDGFDYGVYLSTSNVDAGASAPFTTTLTKNLIVNSGRGIHYDGMAGDLVATGNTVVASNGIGIYVDCDGEPSGVLEGGSYGPITVRDNRVLKSSASGLFLSSCSKGASTISGNSSARNGEVGFYGEDLPGATWSNNRASSNELSGFEIYFANGSTFTGNRADLNGRTDGSGFDFEDEGVDPPDSITGNFARGNSRYGFTVSGDITNRIDGVSSGNVAFGNETADCNHVTCVEAATTGTVLKSCGSSVSSSIVLGDSVDGCGGGESGVLVVPSGARITIDLNGYTLDAGGLASAGVRLSGVGPTKSITIRNGVITGVPLNGAGILVSGSNVSSFSVENVLIKTDSGQMYGVDVETEGVTAVLTDVAISHGDGTFGWGVFSPDGSKVNISKSLITGWNSPVWTGAMQIDRLEAYGSLRPLGGGGTYGDALSSSGSSISNSVLPGIRLKCLPGAAATVTGNLLFGLALITDGLNVSDCAAGAVTNNLVVLQGFRAGYLSNADGFTISGNRLFANNFGFELHFVKSSATIKGNFADGNRGGSGDGFRLVSDGSGAGVRSFANNFARGNGYDGFIFTGSGLKSSGNIAFGNGNVNCTNVICSLGI